MRAAGTKSEEYCYKFSFVMPVYNVEKYLEETIECVLSQSMSFVDHVQLILVNDGSTDGSDSICKRYAKAHPGNIIYIKQENMGVSSARNAGIKLAEGKYISFLDSDDLISSDTLDKVYDFFEAHNDEIDVVSIKLEFFEARTGPHMLNHKFYKTRVIDIEKEYDQVQLSGGSAFIKTSAIQGRYKFDERLELGEDAKLLTEVILEKMAYGVVAEPTYYYRRRATGDSAIGKSASNRCWYEGTLVYTDKYLVDKSLRILGHVPRYVQYLVMYDLQWRFLQEAQSVLDVREVREYKRRLYKLLQYIDDSIILEQKNIHIEHKFYILEQKYGKNISEITERIGEEYFLGDTALYNNVSSHRLYIDIIDIDQNEVTIYGRVGGILLEGVRAALSVGGKKYELQKVSRHDAVKRFLGETIYDGNAFKVTFPVEYGDNVTAFLRTGDGTRTPLPIVGTRLSRMTAFKKGQSYFRLSNYLVCHVHPERLVFTKRSELRHFEKDIMYLVVLAIGNLKHRYSQVRHRGRLGKAGQINHTGQPIFKQLSNSVIIFRIAHLLSRPFIRKRIWLVSDRLSAAGDNGEALFRFIVSQPSKGVKCYFAINKSANDYSRLKQYGRVVNRDSWYYKFLFLHANKIISSHADDFITNAFGDKYHSVSYLLGFDYIFLQHGIIKDDLSGWLGFYKKNIRLFVTSAEKEYKSVLTGQYHYGKNRVILTGLPRYDLLDNNPAGKLIIMPTWRKNIAGEFDPVTNERLYSDGFRHSKYYKFYQQLLSDRRINDALVGRKMKAEFYVHPSFAKQSKDFKRSRNVKIMHFPYDYKEAFTKGDILVTDYSSVAFDFAYLKKPIVYTQFDKESFYQGHLYVEGYFSYENDGFGPVTYDYENTVKAVVEAINSSKGMAKKYVERVDKFFYKTDKNNSHRVYQAILNLDVQANIDVSIRKPLRHILTRFRNKGKAIPTYWWRYKYPTELNFGDEITPYIVRSIWGISAEYALSKDSNLAGTGSIIETLQRSSDGKNIKVWGSGFIGKGEKNRNDNLDFYAVRGPRSCARIEQKRGIALGDPGLLANIVFRKSKKKLYKVGIVPHYIDHDSAVLDTVRSNSDYLIIDPLQTPDKVALDITSCEYVLSSSLHGLIFADSFGVPNNWLTLSNKLAGGDYKFTDYYEATGRKAKKVKPSVIASMDEINRLRSDYQPVVDLKKLQSQLIDSFPYK